MIKFEQNIFDRNRKGISTDGLQQTSFLNLLRISQNATTFKNEK
jgi:hypothetical protein